MNTYKKVLLGLVIGIMSVKWWTFIPAFLPASLIFLFLFVGAFLLSIKTKMRWLHFLMGLLLGAYLSLIRVYLYEQKTELALSIDVNTIISGTVDSLYSENNRLKRLIFNIDTINGKNITPNDFRINVFSSIDKPFKQGESWQLKARLREPYGRANIAGFDAKTYYLAHHIHAKGSLLEAKLLDPHLSLRQRFLNKLLPVFNGYEQGRFLLALAFGERNQLTDTDWQKLKQTGLTHLLAISGLHIGLAFCAVFFVIFHLKPFFFRQDTWISAPYFIACFFAFIYAWAAGFSLPTQRALLALLIWTVFRLSALKLSGFDTFLMVLASLLVFDPFSVFSMSFWLSFSAVGLIALFSSFSFLPQVQKKRTGLYLIGALLQRTILSLLLLQAFLLLGMLPINLYYFGGFSMSALIANTLAIPIVSFITVPALLLALFVSLFYPDNFVWAIADLSLSWVMAIAHFLSNAWVSLPGINLLFIFTLLGFLLVLQLVAQRQRLFIAALGLILLLSWKASSPRRETWQMHVLDVGHGLAVLIERNGQALLYDTGASWGSSSIAKSVIQPVLNKLNLSLRGVMISHLDQDHAGGLKWINQTLKPDWVRSSSLMASHLPCKQGETWTWEGLSFSAIAPEKLTVRPKNAASCVIRVFDGKHSVLLTGDIPKKEEQALIERGAQLKSDLLLVPHHGSLSSSSVAFLQAVAPDIAIASTGRYTPWQLPHPEIIERYQQQNIAWFETRTAGQISVIFSEQGIKITRYRQELSPYWYRKVVGAL